MASLFFVISGSFMLVAAIWGRALNQRLGLRPPAELLTSERLKRSAQIEAKLGILLQLLLGLQLLLHGIMLSSWGSPLVAAVRTIALVPLLGCLLGLLATKIYYWRA